MLQYAHQIKRGLIAFERSQTSYHQRELEVIVMANKRSSINPQGIQYADTRKISAAFFKIRVTPEKLHNGSPCWEWSGFCSEQNYPKLRIGGEYYAHRIFYLYLIGEIPEGHEVDHVCRNRRCCSPFHLEAVPPSINRQRRDNAVTHCRQGHELTPENTRVQKQSNGQFVRHCRTCNRERVRAFNRRNPGYYNKYNKARQDES